MMRLARAAAKPLAPVFTTRTAPQRSLTYNVPIKDIHYMMDIHGYQEHWKGLANKYNRPELLESLAPDMVDMMLQELAKLCENDIFATYQTGDKDGVKWDPKTLDVTTAKGYKECYKKFQEAGWQGLGFPEQYGGQGLPQSLNLIKSEMIAEANWAWSMFPGLTVGATNTLLLHASDAQKDEWCPKLVSGEWLGTMCLTEPQCGTDLSQVKTQAKAVEGKENVFTLTGTKIFISAGEHDFTENIVHIVLARLPNAPEGVKGISLFIVPKYTFEEMKKPAGQRKKNIVCSGVEHKMGIKSSPTCTMSLEDSEGYLVGKPHDGLRQMFTFMNTARLGVAVQAVAHTELGLQNSLKYTLDRCSMPALTGKIFKDKVADPIYYHPDVRRMLLFQKVVAEGGRYIVMKCSKIADEGSFSLDKKVQDKIEQDLGIITPIAKGFMTELSLEATSNAMQCFGGHGYISDHGMEQIYRDARIGTMYEGTTGIQALDLVGRKIFMDKFKGLTKYRENLTSFLKGLIWSHKEKWIPSAARGMYATILKFQLRMVQTGMAMKSDKTKRSHVGAVSNDALFSLGYIMLGEAWLNMAVHSSKALEKGGLSESDKIFHQGKIMTARFYFDKVFPRVQGHIAALHNDHTSVVEQYDSKYIHQYE